MRILADYSILVENHQEDLAREVLHLMGHGWEPSGSVSVAVCPPRTEFDDAAIIYAQAMVLYKEEPTPTD